MKTYGYSDRQSKIRDHCEHTPFFTCSNQVIRHDCEWSSSRRVESYPRKNMNRFRNGFIRMKAVNDELKAKLNMEVTE